MKGQIQTGELIMIVIVVTLMLVIGIALYGSFKMGALEEDIREKESLNAVELAQEAISMQELACSYSEGASSNCIDLYRLEVLTERIKGANTNSKFYNYYRSKFGAARIEVSQVYPEERYWLIYNQSLNRASENQIRLPVFIYDGLQKKNRFAVITVVQYT